MEVVRPRTEIKGTEEDHRPLIEFDDGLEVELELPPPPAPFPVDLLPSPISSTSDQRRVVYANIDSIQLSCVQALSTLLPDDPMLGLKEGDQQLAAALTELLEVCYGLEALRPATPRPPTASLPSTSAPSSSVDIATSYAALTQHLSDLQSAAQARGATPEVSSPPPSQLHPAVNVVREELAWARVESLSHAVRRLVQERTERIDLMETSGADEVNGFRDPFASTDDLANGDDVDPPGYSQHNHGDIEADRFSLPSYQGHGSPESTYPLLAMRGEKDLSSPSIAPTSPMPAVREKMMRELDAVTDAIERLYAVAPQLSAQRVEMRAGTSRGGGAAERDKMRELEMIWDRIESAHGKRRIRADGQRAVLEDGKAKSAARRETFVDSLFDQTGSSRKIGQDSTRRAVDADLERARDFRDRDHFLQSLVKQAGDGRMADQDATSPGGMTPRQKQQAFIADIISRSRASRLNDQDFPHPVEDKLASRRESFLNSVMQASTSGRLRNQDSLPPTPKVHIDGLEDPLELITMQDFFKSRRGSEGAVRTLFLDDGEAKKSPTAFRKIAGIVRRGSLGLGLKANNGVDLASVSYVAEHQEHLRSIQVMLHGAGMSLKDDLDLETTASPRLGDGPHEAIVRSRKDPSSSLHIPLPSAVNPGQVVPFIHQDLQLEGKLSALPFSSSAPVSSLNTVVDHALSAADLRRLRPKAICCVGCDREVAELSPNTVYKDLPSEHWAEMMEVWMCHADPTFTARLGQQTRDGFWPTKETVLVGGSYVLVDGGHAKKHNLCIETTESDMWQVVTCLCGEVVGKRRPHGERPGKGTIRFAKWAIALLRDEDEGESVEPVRFPFSVFIVSDMLELAQAHASYRFVILEEESSERQLLMWLFNPSVRISYRKASSSPLPSPLRSSFMDRRSSLPTRQSSSSARRSTASPARGTVTRTMRVGKIMYKVLDPLDVDSGEVLPGFGPGGQVEELSYSREVCVRLAAALRESTSVYPIARRTMGAFDVGFLERT